MKPPKCKTCGVEEWKHICSPQTDAEKCMRDAMLYGSYATKDGKHIPLESIFIEPPPFDRTAYQREYMRRYRAKKATST